MTSTSTSTDPIEQIKQAEEKSKEQIEKATNEFSKKLSELGEELAGKTNSYEEILRKQSIEKLENAKSEAEDHYKSQMQAIEGEKNKLIGSAKNKEADGVDLVVDKFKHHLKK